MLNYCKLKEAVATAKKALNEHILTLCQKGLKMLKKALNEHI